jgi:hypothetical protein
MRFAFALLSLAVAVPAFAQPAAGTAPAGPTNEDCLVCHGDPELQRADGRRVGVDPAAYARSVHGQLDFACVTCHADLASAELPHAETLARVDCSTCHDAAVTAHRESVHGQGSGEENSNAATCTSCHGVHDILPSADPDSRTYHLNLPRTCGACHGEHADRAATKLPGGDILHRFQDSIHGRALSRGGLLVAPNCTSCHGAHDIRPKSDPASRVFRATVPATCGTCHQGIAHQYARGRHGQALEAGNAIAPVCHDCHTSHEITRAEAPAHRVEVIRECGTCHEQSLTTYRDTYHGQVTELGYARVATCADCHGAHEVLPASDPRSPVSAGRLVQTCQKCHPRANANFVKFDPHADPHNRERNPLLYYTARFMRLLLTGVFGFFGIHTSLWFVRSWHEARRRRAVRAPVRPAPASAEPGPRAGRQAAAGGGVTDASAVRGTAGRPAPAGHEPARAGEGPIEETGGRQDSEEERS